MRKDEFGFVPARQVRRFPAVTLKVVIGDRGDDERDD